MALAELTEQTRQRAPSKRALATKAAVFDAAEKIFAIKGFDGATIRDIAAEAGQPIGTIHHHGGGKERLFQRTVARRAAPLSQARSAALDALKTERDPTLEGILTAFFAPFLTLTQQDPGWRHYARLVAFVSSDPRWRGIAAECFDPTFGMFLKELHALLPKASRGQIAACFVYSVSALLALITSEDRIRDLGEGDCALCDEIDNLIRFCACGMTCCR